MKYCLRLRFRIFVLMTGLLSLLLIYSCSKSDSSPSAPTIQGSPTRTYDCSADIYRCSDFATQEDSQVVFDYCVNAGAGDIHRLDWNNNQISCEEFDRQHEPTVTLTATPTPTPVSAGYSCTPRKTCGQMSSCAEALYQLNTCGYSSLDSDKDGVPCESICSGG